MSFSQQPQQQDASFKIFDDGDNTKKIAFQASGITTGNTRTLTAPDFDGTIATLAGTETLTNKTLTTPTIAQINNSSTPGVKLQLRTQTDNSDSVSSATTAGVFIQMGWGQQQGGGAATLNSTVTFPTSYTTVLGVTVSLLSVKSSPAASDITGLDTAYNTTSFTIGAEDITTSGFTVNLFRASGTFGSGAYYGYSWIAWGV